MRNLIVTPRAGRQSEPPHARVGAAAMRKQRVLAAARALRMEPKDFLAWVIARSAKLGDPVDLWAEPWLICVVRFTELHRSRLPYELMRAGWRIVVTFHGRPVAWITPIGPALSRPSIERLQSAATGRRAP